MPGARGEAVIQAGDHEVTILYTNRALAEAEEQTGKSIMALAEGFTDGRSGIGDMAHLLRAGMEAARRDARAGGRPVSLVAAYQVLDDVGFTAVAQEVLVAVATVLRYSPDDDEDFEGFEDGSPNV